MMTQYCGTMMLTWWWIKHDDKTAGKQNGAGADEPNPPSAKWETEAGVRAGGRAGDDDDGDHDDDDDDDIIIMIMAMI